MPACTTGARSAWTRVGNLGLSRRAQPVLQCAEPRPHFDLLFGQQARACAWQCWEIILVVQLPADKCIEGHKVFVGVRRCPAHGAPNMQGEHKVGHGLEWLQGEGSIRRITIARLHLPLERAWELASPRRPDGGGQRRRERRLPRNRQGCWCATTSPQRRRGRRCATTSPQRQGGDRLRRHRRLLLHPGNIKRTSLPSSVKQC